MENAIVRVPSLEEMGVVQAHQRPGGVHARRRVHPRPVATCAGFWVAAGFCAHGLAGRGRHGQARRRVDRRGHAVARRVAHGLAPLRRRVPLARVHARAHEGDLRDVLRREVPGPRARGRAAAAGLAGQRAGSASSAPPSGRSRAGSARTGSSRTRRRATSRSGRAAGRGSCGRRRSAPSTARAASRRRCSTSRRSRSSRSSARAPPTSSRASAPTASPARSGRVTYTQMLNPRGGIECDFTVTRLGDERFRIVTGTAFGQHDAAWIRQHAPRGRLGAGRRRDVGVRLPRALGAGEPRDPPAAHGHRPRERGLPVHDRAGAGGRAGAVPRRARHVRRRARLGALLPDRVRRAALGRALGRRAGPRARRGRLQGDRLAAAREGLPRLGRRHLAGGHAVRGRARLRRQARQGRLRRPRRAASRRPSRTADCAASRSPTRAPWRSAPSPCASATISSAGSRAAATATRSGASIAYAYLPAEHDVGTEVAVEIFGEWVAGVVAEEPLYDPTGERIRA